MPLTSETVSQMVDRIMTLPKDTALLILAPIVRERKGEYSKLFIELKLQGFLRVRINGIIYEIGEQPNWRCHKKHTIEVVIDRLKVREKAEQRIAESLEIAFGDGERPRHRPAVERSEQTDAFFGKFFLPALRLYIKRTRTSPILVQQSGWGVSRM